MASRGSKNSITGDVSGSVVAHAIYGDVTVNYHASDPAPSEPWARLVHGSKVWCRRPAAVDALVRSISAAPPTILRTMFSC